MKNKCHCGLIRCNKHRPSKTKFYRKYWHIRARCLFEWDKDYKNYGGRGIKFEWNSYQSFYNEMYVSYIKHVKTHGVLNTTIDRLDVNGHYNKKNCIWVTQQQQSLNKRLSRKITAFGRTQNISIWAKEIGCSRQALRYRLNQGMIPELALKTPFKHSNKLCSITTNK